jgi:hypothetical protein
VTLSAVADDHREELVVHAQRSAAAVTLAARQVATARTALTAAQRRAAAGTGVPEDGLPTR